LLAENSASTQAQAALFNLSPDLIQFARRVRSRGAQELLLPS
jgi:hypothetical protein